MIMGSVTKQIKCKRPDSTVEFKIELTIHIGMLSKAIIGPSEDEYLRISICILKIFETISKAIKVFFY